MTVGGISLVHRSSRVLLNILSCCFIRCLDFFSKIFPAMKKTIISALRIPTSTRVIENSGSRILPNRIMKSCNIIKSIEFFYAR